MKKAFIVGINGKMGKMLCSVANEYGYEVVGGYDIVGCGDTVFNDPKKVNVDFDVIIDFSRPDPNTLSAISSLCTTKKVPAVIATTGFCESGVSEIKKLSKSVPVFFSGNMSLGIAAAKAAAITAQKILGDGFDIEIVEKHHNQKVDSPSGTAYLLADALAPRDKQVVNRSGKRNKGELGITSIRGGDVVGEHEIGFYGDSEIVTISHSARSRKLFAAGAYKAADLMIKSKPGLYNMDDLVKEMLN